ncbi:hypothetical protein [Scytonema hofmannii]|uniref:hypothetical protein n=1 Tax=Scytonema hofmannii TaxID=34078 RepID=UPI00034B6DEA|nr:hypothetical protein [Scytonema hofmannii]
MKNSKFHWGIQAIWNPDSALDVFGFVRGWKWMQSDRHGYSFCIGYLVIVFGKADDSQGYIDPFDEKGLW